MDRYQRIETKASVHDLESLKDFMRKVAYGIDGEDAEDQEFDVPGWETVRKYWNAFTAAWQRAYPTESIPRGIAQSVTEVSILTLVHHWISKNVDFSTVHQRAPGRRDGHAKTQETS